MVYVITGGPGFGKTTLVNHLANLGYPVCPESARELLTAGAAIKGKGFDISTDFEQIVAGHRLKFLENADVNRISFADRGLPDQVAYSWYKMKIPSSFIETAVRTGRYAPQVFVTPPWEKIFTTDDVRRENFEEASAIHVQILRAYREFGYETIELPLADPETRVEFILKFLGEKDFRS